MEKWINEAQRKAFLTGEIGHAYIISGDAAGRKEVAKWLTKRLFCLEEDAAPCHSCNQCAKVDKGIHPDEICLAPLPDKKEIGVAQMRDLITSAHIRPNEARRKVFVIEPADALNASAQNACLKTLEEPPGAVTFLFLTENAQTLLQTVRSRCGEVILLPQDESVLVADETAALLTRFEGAVQTGGLVLLEFCVGLEKLERGALVDFIEHGYPYFIEQLSRANGKSTLFRELIPLFASLKQDLRFHVSAGHISGKILATVSREGVK